MKIFVFNPCSVFLFLKVLQHIYNHTQKEFEALPFATPQTFQSFKKCDRVGIRDFCFFFLFHFKPLEAPFEGSVICLIALAIHRSRWGGAVHQDNCFELRIQSLLKDFCYLLTHM